MVEYWLDFFQHTIYLIELFLVCEWIFHNRVKCIKRYVLFITAYLVAMLFARDMQVTVATIFEVLLFLFLFQGKLKKKLICFLEIYLSTGILEVMVGGLLTLIPNELFRHNKAVCGLIATIISALLVCIVVRNKWLDKFFDYLSILKWHQKLAVIIVAISCVLLLVISEIVLVMIDNQSLSLLFHVISVVLYSAIIGGIVALVYGMYQTDYYSQQNKLKNQIIYEQQQYYKKIYENDREMRRFRHDINAQLGCLSILLQEGRITEAIGHLKSIEKDFADKIVHRFRTGNEILDVVINQAYLKSKEKNIELEVRGQISKNQRVDVYDLCTIFFNAINNGIEAYESDYNQEKKIDISMLEQGNILFIKFENFATEEMYAAIKHQTTTKKDSKTHGFGVENIRRAVEKNNGQMEYKFDNNKIALEIYFEI